MYIGYRNIYSIFHLCLVSSRLFLLQELCIHLYLFTTRVFIHSCEP